MVEINKDFKESTDLHGLEVDVKREILSQIAQELAAGREGKIELDKDRCYHYKQLLILFSKDPEDVIRQIVGFIPDTPEPTLDVLSRDPIYVVRAAVAGNPFASDKALEKLAEEHNFLHSGSAQERLEERKSFPSARSLRELGFNLPVLAS